MNTQTTKNKIGPRLLALIMLLALFVMASGCSAPAADEPAMDHENMEMADDAASSEMHASDVIHATLLPGENGESVTIQLTDAEGDPITDAMVSLEGNMNHAGMVPVVTDSVADDADGAADGAYLVPFGFTMNGDWIITVNAELADGSTETQDVNVTVTEEGVEVN